MAGTRRRQFPKVPSGTKGPCGRPSYFLPSLAGLLYLMGASPSHKWPGYYHCVVPRLQTPFPPIVHASNFCRKRATSMTVDGVSLTIPDIFMGVKTVSTGVKIIFTGVEMDFTGVETPSTDAKMALTGVKSGFTAIAMDSTVEKKMFTGVEMILAGVKSVSTDVEMTLFSISAHRREKIVAVLYRLNT